jgi:DNA replication licensing factor MCM2
MDEADQFESVGLDDSVEDERDFDQIMEDRRAAEVELDNRDGRASNRSKLPQLLHDQGNHFTFFFFHFNFCIINFLITS